MPNNKRNFSHQLSDVKLPHDKKKLKDLAKKTKQDVPVWEGGFFIPMAFLILSLALFSTAYPYSVNGIFLTSMILYIFAAFLLFIFCRTILRRRTPYFILTPYGLVTSVFKTPINWNGIQDFQINSSKTNAMNIAVGMEFLIDPKFLPEQNIKRRWGSYYDTRTEKLYISGFNFHHDMNRDKLIEMILLYRNAALARQKLEQRSF
ncbi:hypothetical protein [Bartonella tamiae]|uniref:Uncharacterized protein n=1 Tax=Bartonella tamiae Th239 TaxID=1094558 RepID=J1K125_9HYPH|nr:hypothetical protein [Bartonella tamiae]EJF91142.1 hypothetical protein ME5_00474 [Bartonella tamiae Th239]EJF93193.1 hypothetical protein MEG_01407 [Bartonella tamiae Th307]